MTTTPFDVLIQKLRKDLHDLIYEIDPPATDIGEWFVDLQDGDWNSTVSWRPDRKFGLFTSHDGYGERPDEIFADADKAATRLSQMASRFRLSGETGSFTLKDIRQLMGGSQEAVASLLGKDQGEVSRLEKRSDAKLATIERYISALGGRMSVQVVFDDFAGALALDPQAPKATKPKTTVKGPRGNLRKPKKRSPARQKAANAA